MEQPTPSRYEDITITKHDCKVTDRVAMWSEECRVDLQGRRVSELMAFTTPLTGEAPGVHR